MNTRSRTFTEALARIENICARREKSPAEVLSLLRKWGLDPEESNEILHKLRLEKYIDENRYASAFVRDKIKFEHWGFVKIRIALQRKGIPLSVVEEAVKNMDEEAYRNMIRNELGKKKKLLKVNASDCWQKLARFGFSRGYEMEIMHGMLEEICREGKR